MFQVINFDTLPLWATILKRILVILILTALGLHAYVQYKRQTRMSTPERWAFLAFSVVMMFGVIVNVVSIAFAAKLNLRKGPYNFGSFSLFLFIIYLIFAGGITHRKRTF
ncbi:MAG: hypothetical protein ABFD64_03770 [Armatimonadota bacterium]